MNLHPERLADVHPLVVAKFVPFQQACASKLNCPLLIVRGWSSVRDQLLKYQQGRELQRDSNEWIVVDKAKVVTNAKPGMSGHNVIVKATGKGASMCIDVIPLDKHGQPLWATTGENEFALDRRWIDTFDADELTMWTRIWELAHKFGLDPLGDTVGAYLQGDNGHFEEAGYKYILDELKLAYPSSVTQDA